jgi:hypothetical protein
LSPPAWPSTSTIPRPAFARYEDIRRERTATVVRKSHENRKSAFSPALADPASVAVESRANGSRSACANAWMALRL